MKKLTPSKIKAFMKDEKMASAEYKSYGLNRLSKDEHFHNFYLKQKLKSIKSKSNSNY